jgi:hypothetical protein
MHDRSFVRPVSSAALVAVEAAVVWAWRLWLRWRWRWWWLRGVGGGGQKKKENVVGCVDSKGDTSIKLVLRQERLASAGRSWPWLASVGHGTWQALAVPGG